MQKTSLEETSQKIPQEIPQEITQETYQETYQKTYQKTYQENPKSPHWKSCFDQKKNFPKRDWDLLPKELQSTNVELEKNIKNAEKELEKYSEQENSNSEKLLWKLVLANLNFPKNAKTISKLQPNVQENSTDAPEDVWEKHAKLVLD